MDRPANVGDQTWTQNTKLAPTPRDVASPLAHGLWLSPTRITGPDADTPPDAVGRFSFQIAANTPGDYYQTFGLVEDGVTWFSDPAANGGGPPDDQLEIHVVVTPAPPDPTTASSGEETGETGDPSASGTAGEVLAPMVVDPLITEAAAARQRGLAVLADTGRQIEVGLRLPVLAAPAPSPRSDLPIIGDPQRVTRNVLEVGQTARSLRLGRGPTK